jgi:hypothetical protein
MTRRRSSTGIVRFRFVRVDFPGEFMRATTISSCLVIAAAIVIAASASAQTFQKKPDGAKAAPMIAQPLQKKPQGDVKASPPKVLTPTSPARPQHTSPTAPKGKNFVPLSAGDCADLGGTVVYLTICKSGQACSRKDENGKTHQVCLHTK